MTKKMTILLLCITLMFALVLPVSGEAVSYIADQAGLLTTEEITSLEEKAASLAAAYGIDPVIVTVDSLGGQSAQNYADNYYDHAGYGDDGVLFLLAMAEREWYISTCGSVIYALTDYGVQQLGESIVPSLAEEYWYTALYDFLDTLPYYLDAYENGAPMDGYADDSGEYYHADQEEVVYFETEHTPNFLLSLLGGSVVSAIVLFFMKRSMNTKRPQRSAGEYLTAGSWHLTQHSDLFLYSNVTKTRKQDPPKSSGGGSSVHRSSGGRSHGGGGGRF